MSSGETWHDRASREELEAEVGRLERALVLAEELVDLVGSTKFISGNKKFDGAHMSLRGIQTALNHCRLQLASRNLMEGETNSETQLETRVGYDPEQFQRWIDESTAWDTDWTAPKLVGEPDVADGHFRDNPFKPEGGSCFDPECDYCNFVYNQHHDPDTAEFVLDDNVVEIKPADFIDDFLGQLD